MKESQPELPGFVIPAPPEKPIPMDQKRPKTRERKRQLKLPEPKNTDPKLKQTVGTDKFQEELKKEIAEKNNSEYWDR